MFYTKKNDTLDLHLPALSLKNHHHHHHRLADSMESPDSLSLSVLIVHCFCQVL